MPNKKPMKRPEKRAIIAALRIQNALEKRIELDFPSLNKKFGFYGGLLDKQLRRIKAGKSPDRSKLNIAEAFYLDYLNKANGISRLLALAIRSGSKVGFNVESARPQLIKMQKTIEDLKRILEYIKKMKA